MRGLCVLVHGPSKSGKSWLGDSTPAPRLVLDAEAGSEFTPSRKKIWDPVAEAPPTPDGTWDTALVQVNDYNTVKIAYDWLNSGQHPFNSVVIDSISEVQQRCVTSIAGVNPMQTQDWGTLLREVGGKVRDFKDLKRHKVRPLQAVLFIAMTRMTDGQYTPYVQGQLATTLPYFPDVVGYIATQASEDGVLHRYLMIQPDQRWMTGERVGGKLGSFIELLPGEPTFINMLDAVFGPAETDANGESDVHNHNHESMGESA